MNIVEKLRLMQTDHIPELGEAIAEIEHLRREAHAYARDNGKRSVADALAMDINEVVDSMPTDTLDHAMDQVNRTIADNLGKDTGV